MTINLSEPLEDKEASVQFAAAHWEIISCGFSGRSQAIIGHMLDRMIETKTVWVHFSPDNRLTIGHISSLKDQKLVETHTPAGPFGNWYVKLTPQAFYKMAYTAINNAEKFPTLPTEFVEQVRVSTDLAAK